MHCTHGEQVSLDVYHLAIGDYMMQNVRFSAWKDADSPLVLPRGDYR